jgi:hypothetical protein
MVQALSRWFVTAEARVCARAGQCGIWGGQSGTEKGFSSSSSVLPLSISFHQGSILIYHLEDE